MPGGAAALRHTAFHRKPLPPRLTQSCLGTALFTDGPSQQGHFVYFLSQGCYMAAYGLVGLPVAWLRPPSCTLSILCLMPCILHSLPNPHALHSVFFILHHLPSYVLCPVSSITDLVFVILHAASSIPHPVSRSKRAWGSLRPWGLKLTGLCFALLSTHLASAHQVP